MNESILPESTAQHSLPQHLRQTLSLYDFTFEQLGKQLTEMGEPAFRARQIWQWMYQRMAGSIDEMTDLPKPLRAKLSDKFALNRITPVTEAQSSDGWTRKWLLRFPDGSEIETVLMEYDGVRRTACISSQAGCAMNCSFCATGQMGFLRNLRAGEIIEQVMWVARHLRFSISDFLPNPTPRPEVRNGHRGRLPEDRASNPKSRIANPKSDSDRLSNLVLMGMGEPFANYQNVMEAVHRVMMPEAQGGFGLGARKITVSTVGLVPGIRKFTAEDSQVNLAVSLHAATDELRNQLVPVNQRYPLHDLTKSVRDYLKQTNRRVSYEWALIDNVNDTPEQADALVEVVQKTNPTRANLVHVNMIPLNPTGGYRGRASAHERRQQFREILDHAGIPNTMRVRRGIDIAAGCGQLKAETAA